MRSQIIFSLFFIKHILIIIPAIFSASNYTEYSNNSSPFIPTPYPNNNEFKFTEEEIDLIKGVFSKYISEEFTLDKNFFKTKLCLNELADLFEKFSLKNDNPVVFNNFIINALKLDNFYEKILLFLKQQNKFDFYFEGKCEFNHPKSIKRKQSAILSLLYMIKKNTPLLNTLIEYSNNEKFSQYLIDLKKQTTGEIKLNNFNSMINNYDYTYCNYFDNIIYILNAIIKQNCTLDIYQYFFFNNYCIDNVFNQKDSIENEKWEFPFSNGIPLLSSEPLAFIRHCTKEYCNIFSKDERHELRKLCFLKAPPFAVISTINDDHNSEIEFNESEYIWNTKYIPVARLEIILYSIQEGSIKYKLTGFITSEIQNIKHEKRYLLKYKPFYKYNGQWNDEFNDYFILSHLNKGEIKVKYNYYEKIKITTFFYERIFEN